MVKRRMQINIGVLQQLLSATSNNSLHSLGKEQRNGKAVGTATVSPFCGHLNGLTAMEKINITERMERWGIKLQ